MDQKLSVFHLFSELFPEYANDKDRDGGTTGGCLSTRSGRLSAPVAPCSRVARGLRWGVRRAVGRARTDQEWRFLQARVG